MFVQEEQKKKKKDYIFCSFKKKLAYASFPPMQQTYY